MAVIYKRFKDAGLRDLVIQLGLLPGSSFVRENVQKRCQGIQANV